MTPAALDRLLWWSRTSPPAQPQTTLVRTEVADVRLRDTGGVAPTVVFFCDPPVMVDHYDALIAAMGTDVRVVVVELPGHGFSRPTSTEALGFSRAVDAVELALSQQVGGPMVLCGPCVCGFVATELAQRGVLPVAGLVLSQTPDLAGMLAWTERMDPKGRLRTPYLGQLLTRLSARRLAAWWFRYATARATDHHAMTATTTDALAAGGRFPLATMLQRWRTGPRDHGLELPTLAVWGQQDRSHTGTPRTSTQAHAPGAQLVTLEQCGHFPELEDPAAFAEAALPFVREAFAQYGASAAP